MVDLTDSELLEKTAIARFHAHDARADNYHRQAMKWVELVTECERRSLPSPKAKTREEIRNVS